MAPCPLSAGARLGAETGDSLLAALPYVVPILLLVISGAAAVVADRYVSGLTDDQRLQVSRGADAVALTAAVPSLILAGVADALRAPGLLTWVVVLALATAAGTVVAFVVLLHTPTPRYAKWRLFTVSYVNWGLGMVYMILAVVAYIAAAARN